ncbi:MAG: DMT family transporter [Chloroflexi bacterium]|nr:DMT family transporter [Chloroflexota bacterium]
MGELAALGSALVWAANGVLVKSMTRVFSALPFNALRCLFTALLFWAILLATGRTATLLETPLWTVIGLLFSATIGIGIGDTVYLVGLTSVEASRAYPISLSSYPVITMVIAALFLGESITLPTILGAFAVILGVYLVASSQQRGKGLDKAPKGQFRGLFLIFVAAFCWAVSISILKVVLGKTDVLIVNAIRLSWVVILLLGLSAREMKKMGTWHAKKLDLGLGALTGVLDYVVGGLLFLVAIQMAGAAKTSILFSTSPLFLLPISAIFLKERIGPKHILGVVSSIAGIALLMYK